MLPCPWCILRLPHGHGAEQSIHQALHAAKKNVASGHITTFQYGILRCAAAEVLVQSRVASAPDEAISFVVGMEKEPFSLWSARRGCSSAGERPPPPPPSVPPPRLSMRAGADRPPPPPPRTRSRVSAVGSVASAPVEANASIFAFDAATQATPAASRAASASHAWLAPGASSSGASSSAPVTTSSAIVPAYPSTSTSSASSAGPAHDEWVWQVQTGKGKKRKWSQVEDALAAVLEHAYTNGHNSCSWTWNSWVYDYDLTTMTQISGGEARTVRPMRRIPYDEAYAEG